MCLNIQQLVLRKDHIVSQETAESIKHNNYTKVNLIRGYNDKDKTRLYQGRHAITHICIYVYELKIDILTLCITQLILVSIR